MDAVHSFTPSPPVYSPAQDIERDNRRQPLLPEVARNTQGQRNRQTESREKDGRSTAEKHKTGRAATESSADATGKPLSEAEQREVEALQKRDYEVREHEKTHARVGAPYTGAPNYEFEQGPDGKRYAVAGHVKIDMSKVADDPEATIAKAEKIQAAALAPKEPSSADHQVAAKAKVMAQQARQEMAESALQEHDVIDEETAARGVRVAQHYHDAVSPYNQQQLAQV